MREGLTALSGGVAFRAPDFAQIRRGTDIARAGAVRSILLVSFLALAACRGFATHDEDFAIPAPPPPPSSTGSVVNPVPITKPMPSGGGYTFDPYAAHTSKTAYLAIEAGDHFTCGIRDDHTVDCWGQTLAGQPAKLTEISASGPTACGLDPDGALQCWGASGGFDAPIGGKLSKVGVGDGFACALDEDGHPHCWGPNAIVAPADVALTELAVGAEHACGLKSDGHAVCWGNGDAATKAGKGLYFAIAAGPQTTCAVSQGDHSVDCWGLLGPVQTDGVSTIAVTKGRGCGLRDGDQTPICFGLEKDDWLLPPIERMVSISIGPTHACGIRSADGLAVCWGSDTFGESTPPF